MTQMRRLVLAAGLALSSQAAMAEIIEADGWARASILASRPAAAYIVVTSDRDDRLIRVTTPAAERVMIHAVETGSDGRSRMTEIRELPLTPDVPVVMAPGKMHLMLMQLNEKLVEGGRLALTLEFLSGEQVRIEVPILGPAASGPEDK